MAQDALIARLKTGERAALEALLDQFGERVSRLARRYADNLADAEDLTQDIFLALFQSAQSFRGESEIGTWVYRVALNHCLKWREKSRRELPQFESENDEWELPCADLNGDPQFQLARGELNQQLSYALEKLSEPHRQIVILHELHSLTYTQCAAVLEIPIGTVKSRLWNAFRALRTELGPYLAEPDKVGGTR